MLVRRTDGTRHLPATLSAAWVLLAILSGALSTHTATCAEEPLDESPISSLDRDHWSFQPLSSPAVPAVDSDWVRNPVDAFIWKQLAKRDLQPQPEAQRRTLIRRLSFNLTGLPPTAEQIESFVNDRRPDAYERLVEQLLASPAYGERWAQHWLDLARFAETDGFEHDQTRSEAWKYRDWVVDALNADMPYDRFVRWQLAGDILDSEQGSVATYFCIAGPDMPDINSRVERRHSLLNDIASTVGEVLLGLQMGCAQCHDHKYDPISQGDFYRLRAIFDASLQLEKNKSVTVLENHPRREPSHLMLRGDWQRPGPEVQPAYPRIANPWNDVCSLDQESQPARAQLANWITRPDHPLTVRVIVNRIWQYHFGRGFSATPSDVGLVGDVPSHPELLDWLAQQFVQHDWSLKWLHRTIVMSATYRQAGSPSASRAKGAQLAEARAAWDAARESDPMNYWLARFPMQRLDGESIRDAMLACGGSLNPAHGGPGVRPPLPEELVATLLKNQWNVSEQTSDHYRRSVYVFARRNLRYPIFESFDRPSANASCARRFQSTSATQSLLILNSRFALEMAQRMAGRVWQLAGDRADRQIQSAYQLAFARAASSQESAAWSEFLSEQAELLRSADRAGDSMALPVPSPSDADPFRAAALTDLCLALFNASEFIYLD